jgi:hypothetical protein
MESNNLNLKSRKSSAMSVQFYEGISLVLAGMQQGGMVKPRE